jgi:hypothetical protein
MFSTNGRKTPFTFQKTLINVLIEVNRTLQATAVGSLQLRRKVDGIAVCRS